MVNIFPLILLGGITFLSQKIASGRIAKKLTALVGSFYPVLLMEGLEKSSFLVMLVSYLVVFYQIYLIDKKSSYPNIFAIATVPYLSLYSLLELGLIEFLCYMLSLQLVFQFINHQGKPGVALRISFSSTLSIVFLMAIACVFLGQSTFPSISASSETLVGSILSALILISGLKIAGYGNGQTIGINRIHIFILTLILSQKLMGLFPSIISFSPLLLPLSIVVAIWFYNFKIALNQDKAVSSINLFVANLFLLFFSSFYLGTSGYYLFFASGLILLSLSSLLKNYENLKVFRYLYLGLPLSPQFIHTLYCLNSQSTELDVTSRLPLVAILVLPLVFYTKLINEDDSGTL